MSSSSSAMSTTTTTTTTTTTSNQEVVDNGSNTAYFGEYFDIELKVDKCKFYPFKPLAVIAGNVVSVTSVVTLTTTTETSIIDHSESTTAHQYQQQLQIGDRCLVNVAPSTGQVLLLLKRWANECRENKKCTNWITIAEHMVTCRIDVDTTMIMPMMLRKSRSVSDAYILRCSRPGAIVRICDPPTLDVTILMDQSKFYPSKLAILDGVILKVNENTPQSLSSSSSISTSSSAIRNSNKDLSFLLEKGERCWLHVRSNVVSLLKTLHGESMSGIDDDNENENADGNNGNNNATNVVNSKKKNSKIATGWVQFTRSIPVTCRVVIDDSLLKRKCNVKGAFTLECYEVIDIQKGKVSSSIVPTRNNNYNNLLQKQHVSDMIAQNRDTVHHPLKRLDRKERHRVFAEWLVKTYGADILSTGSGVLDVAGGGGALGHALWNLGIKSCLLDPDPRCDVNTVPFQVIDEPLSGDGLQLTGVADNDRNEDDDDEDEDEDSNKYPLEDPIATKRRSRIRKLVRSCSIIVGMHPDEATEAVIDTSLRLGKPFAILPCCVFRNLNSERSEIRKQKLGGGSGGDPFRSYNTFCQYLLDNKAPAGIRFETENLPFEGRNKVIYLQSYGYTCQVIHP